LTTPETPPEAAALPKGAKSSLWNDLFLDVGAPTLILTQLSERLGPSRALMLALAFPLGHAAWKYFKEGRIGMFPALGVVGTLLTGGVGLFQLDPSWVAVKEALLPGAISIAFLATTGTRWSVSTTFLDQVLDLAAIRTLAKEKAVEPPLEGAIRLAGWLLGGTFALSAALNFALARYVVHSPAGTAEFNSELGTMSLYSIPVVTIPVILASTASLWRLVTTIERLTGEDIQKFLRQGV
jgi:hypothetical protein